MTVADSAGLLADGSRPKTPEELLAFLRQRGIEASTMHHPPVFTVDEAKALRGEIEGSHTKNLMLRNKKGKMWLVVCREDVTIDLRSLARELGAGRFSFASSERLMKYLGVVPGAVTPFGVINDHGGHVRVVLDRQIFDREPLNFHPLDNSMTTSISGEGFLAFLEAVEHPPEIVDLS